jgi:hypothetical protein
VSEYNLCTGYFTVTTEPDSSEEGFCERMTNRKERDNWYHVVSALIIHTVIGLAYFAAMAIPAVIIYKINELLDRYGVTGFTMTMLHAAEAVLLVFDFYAVCRYAYSSIKEGH